MNVALGEIDTFSKISGLKLNKKKSVGLCIGQSKNNPEGEEGISWAKVENKIKILGVYFNANLEASKIPHNWTGKCEDIFNSASKDGLNETSPYMGKLSLQKLLSYRKSILLYSLYHFPKKC